MLFNLSSDNQEESIATATVTKKQPQLPPPPEPPEPLDTVEFCAEKCRYVPEMCTENRYRDHLSFPAPSCLQYSLTVPDDIYYSSMLSGGTQDVHTKRDLATIELVSWAAARARERREARGEVIARCEDIPTEHAAPMMFPEEFEFVVKLLTNSQPENYLEWGCGKSTSFYPLLASGDVFAIDGYPPWCAQVSEEPRVNCMSAKEKRLHFYCPELLAPDGTKLELLATGRLSSKSSDADVEAAMDQYVNAIDKLNVTYLDVALVDGRFRVQCALKLLPYLSSDSVLLIHDFWVRYKPYHDVLDYFDVIGYARSVVAMKKKTDLNLSDEEEKDVYKKFMTREHAAYVEFL